MLHRIRQPLLLLVVLATLALEASQDVVLVNTEVAELLTAPFDALTHVLFPFESLRQSFVFAPLVESLDERLLQLLLVHNAALEATALQVELAEDFVSRINRNIVPLQHQIDRLDAIVPDAVNAVDA